MKRSRHFDDEERVVCVMVDGIKHEYYRVRFQTNIIILIKYIECTLNKCIFYNLIDYNIAIYA